MKKVFKSISVIVLSLALAVSGLTFVQTANADETSDWKENAIISPTKGSLVGAGYIEVEFYNSLPGYTYEVLLDGKSMYKDANGNILRPEFEEDTSQGEPKTYTSSDTPKAEVYTTEVGSHEITVKATRPNYPGIISDPVTIYVSKKGLAMGDNMGTKVSLKELNCSWYYNWGTKAFNNSVDSNVKVPHIPMMWGGYEDSIEDMQNLDTKSNYFLGFNEPDIESQANMFFADAIPIWNQYIEPLKLRKVSPAPADPGGSSGWLYSFMNGATICQLHDGTWTYYKSIYAQDPEIEATKRFQEGVDIDKVDSVCLHYYRNTIDANGIIKAVNNLWETYHKPIWITEIGLFGVKGIYSDMSYELPEKRAEIQQYLQTIVERLDSIPYVERYCWFPYDVDSTNEIDIFNGSGATAMFEYATGLYTDLGRMYSQIGNPSGYSATTIPSSKSFDWDNRVKTDIEYNAKNDNVKVSWSTGAITDFSRIKILIDENEYNITSGDTVDTSELDKGNHTVRFTFYDSGDNVIIEKARAFTIDRSEVPTEQTTTPKATTKPDSNTNASTPSVPSKASLTKAKNVKKKSVKLTWKKVAGANKYKVQWAMNKKFTKKLKTKITTALTYKVSKLKKKKTYFFRIAAMNDAGIGAWSNVKKVKIKK